MSFFRTCPLRPRVVTFVALAMTLVGCSSDIPTSPSSLNPPASSQLSSASTHPSTDQRHAIGVAYTQFWPRSLAIASAPEGTWQAAMRSLATEPQLTTTVAAMHRNKQVGVKPYGEVTTHISSIEVRGDTATIIDCQDGSHSGQADVTTGDRKTVGSPQIPIRAEMSFDASDSQWKVAHLEYPGGTC